MTKFKIQNKSIRHKALADARQGIVVGKIQMSNIKTKNVLLFVICALALFCALCFDICHLSFAQDSELEFTLDVTSNTIPLPKVFKPNIDLSGRGFHRDPGWPQNVAAREVLDTWQKEIGFNGLYRLQYNLWEINQLAKNKDFQDSLLRNYEKIIKDINDADGVVLLDIFGTPASLGKVLDKRSPPRNLRTFKELIKSHIRNLSYHKRYNIWYEVWSAPDSEDFFLGRKQEYFNLYRVAAEAIKELEVETKIHIPLGGPSVSWWFQNFDGNTIVTAEESLIYELIKFCYRNHLPLDFITWHGFSADPKTEKEITVYNKAPVALIRDWLTYFRFDRDTPLIVDEWNYDRGASVLPGRKETSFICASYIPARLKNMFEAGLNYQLYFSLEDFQNNKEGVVRNTGIFWFNSESSEYKGGPKSIYNVFRMLVNLGEDMFVSSEKLKDEFVGLAATRGKGHIALLIYNYIDPDIAMNYLSRTIASLNGAERKSLLGLIKSDSLTKIMQGLLDISRPRLTNKTRAVLRKAKELSDKAAKFNSLARNIKVGIKNLKENYLYQRYSTDSSCSQDCAFVPVEEKEINPADLYEETLSLSPYSVNLIILRPKPKEPEVIMPPVEGELTNQTQESPPVDNANNTNATETKKE